MDWSQSQQTMIRSHPYCALNTHTNKQKEDRIAMSSLYKRADSQYYWWTTWYKGRKVYKSTKMKQKHLARKVQQHWDLNLVLGNLEFLGFSTLSPATVTEFCRHYLNFLTKRKSENTVAIAKGVLKKLQEHLDSQGVRRLDEITVKVLNGYIDWLDCTPKTKKNHMGVVSLMLDQAIREDVIRENVAKLVTLPEIKKKVKHRLLESIDLKIIHKGAGSWLRYYSFLYHTGLRAGDVAMLTYGNLDRAKRSIVSFVRKSRQIHELPLAQVLLDQLPTGRSKDEPLFPELYADTERKLNDNLMNPRKFMQALLNAAERPKATLHSFRVTFNNTLRDMGLSIEDRQILLAHSSSETTKIYTHPNFDLASKFVNRIPDYAFCQTGLTENVTKT